jgi:hypothetical protein
MNRADLMPAFRRYAAAVRADDGSPDRRDARASTFAAWQAARIEPAPRLHRQDGSWVRRMTESG